MGYEFGDVSKAVAKKVTNAVNKKTGKDKYEFGDLTWWLDLKAKENAASIMGKEEYEFGDLSRWIDSRVKNEVNALSGKPEYEFGDLTKEIVKRVLTGEYDLMEIVSLCKILLKFGVGVRPVAGFIPAKVLIELLNISIVQNLGYRIIGSFAEEVDRRLKKSILKDEKRIQGDLLINGINKFTEKNNYTFGDITKTVLADIDDQSGVVDKKKPKTLLSDSSLEISSDVLAQLENWDENLSIPNTFDFDKNNKSKA